jgi:hypothetical protein
MTEAKGHRTRRASPTSSRVIPGGGSSRHPRALKAGPWHTEMQLMQALVVSGLVALIGVSLAVGVKLLLLARRTHAFPELALGLFFLLGAGLGYPLSAAAGMAGAWQPVLAAGSSLFVGTATMMLYSFTARVFHPGERWAWGGVALGVALCLVYIVGYSTSQLTARSEEELVRSTMIWGGVSLVMSFGAYGWTSVESLRQYALHRRRHVLGLSDPVVTNRMLLWGLMGLTTIAVVVIDACLLYSGSTFARQIAIPLVTSMGGLLFGAFLMLAFFPPAAYLARVRRSARTVQGARP